MPTAVPELWLQNLKRAESALNVAREAYFVAMFSTNPSWQDKIAARHAAETTYNYAQKEYDRVYGLGASSGTYVAPGSTPSLGNVTSVKKANEAIAKSDPTVSGSPAWWAAQTAEREATARANTIAPTTAPSSQIITQTPPQPQQQQMRVPEWLPGAQIMNVGLAGVYAAKQPGATQESIQSAVTQEAAGFNKTVLMPAGDRTAIAVEKSKYAVDPISGEIGVYQVPINPYTGLPRTGIYGAEAGGMLIGGTGRYGAQSGTVSEYRRGMELSTPDIREQYNPAKYNLKYADVAKAEDVRRNPDAYSRLGSEAYFGSVQRLDSRKLTPSSKMGVYPRESGNLANLAFPWGANVGKSDYPGANIPWSVSMEAPSRQFLGPGGFMGEAPSPFSTQSLGSTKEEIGKSIIFNSGLPFENFPSRDRSKDKPIGSPLIELRPPVYDTPSRPKKKSTTEEDRIVMVKAPDLTMQPDYMVPAGNATAQSVVGGKRMGGTGFGMPQYASDEIQRRSVEFGNTFWGGVALISPEPISQEKWKAYATASKSRPVESTIELYGSGLRGAKDTAYGAAAYTVNSLTGLARISVLPKNTEVIKGKEPEYKTTTTVTRSGGNQTISEYEQNPIIETTTTTKTPVPGTGTPDKVYEYGGWSRFAEGSGRVARAVTGISEEKLSAYETSIRSKPGLVGDLERIEFGAAKFMLTEPANLAPAAITGAALAYGGAAIGGAVRAVAGGTSRVAPAASWLMSPTGQTVAKAGIASYFGTAYGIGVTETKISPDLKITHATKEQTEFNIGSTLPGLGAMFGGAGGLNWLGETRTVNLRSSSGSSVRGVQISGENFLYGKGAGTGRSGVFVGSERGSYRFDFGGQSTSGGARGAPRVDTAPRLLPKPTLAETQPWKPTKAEAMEYVKSRYPEQDVISHVTGKSFLDDYMTKTQKIDVAGKEKTVRLYRGVDLFSSEGRGKPLSKPKTWEEYIDSNEILYGDPSTLARDNSYGRWYADSLAEGKSYPLEDNIPGALKYVDVPVSVAEKYRVSNIPIKDNIKTFEGRPAEDAPWLYSSRLMQGKEIFLPYEYASQGKLLKGKVSVEEARAVIEKRYPEQGAIWDRYMTDVQMMHPRKMGAGGKKGSRQLDYPEYAYTPKTKTVGLEKTEIVEIQPEYKIPPMWDTSRWGGGYDVGGMGIGGGGESGGGGGSMAGSTRAGAKTKSVAKPELKTITTVVPTDVTTLIASPISYAKPKSRPRSESLSESVSKSFARSAASAAATRPKSRPASYDRALYDSSIYTGMETYYAPASAVASASGGGVLPASWAGAWSRGVSGYRSEVGGIAKSAASSRAMAKAEPMGRSLSIATPPAASLSIGGGKSRGKSMSRYAPKSDSVTRSRGKPDKITIVDRAVGVPTSRAISTPRPGAITEISRLTSIDRIRRVVDERPLPPGRGPRVTKGTGWPQVPPVPPLGLDLRGGGGLGGGSRRGRGANRETIGIRSSLEELFAPVRRATKPRPKKRKR